MWYKLDYRSGPGHQSHEDIYIWTKEDVMEDENLKDDYIEVSTPYWCLVGYHDVACEVSPVEELPDDVRIDKIEKYEYQIERAQAMLAILNK